MCSKFKSALMQLFSDNVTFVHKMTDTRTKRLLKEVDMARKEVDLVESVDVSDDEIGKWQVKRTTVSNSDI